MNAPPPMAAGVSEPPSPRKRRFSVGNMAMPQQRRASVENVQAPADLNAPSAATVVRARTQMQANVMTSSVTDSPMYQEQLDKLVASAARKAEHDAVAGPEMTSENDPAEAVEDKPLISRAVGELWQVQTRWQSLGLLGKEQAATELLGELRANPPPPGASPLGTKGMMLAGRCGGARRYRWVWAAEGVPP